MSKPEEHLFELLDKITEQPRTFSLSALQEACVQVPQLSARLNGRNRYRLYYGLAFDKNPVRSPDDFTPHALHSTDNHKEVAAQLKEVFADETLTDAELQGFVYHFATAADCYFDDELTVITLALATMLAAAELPAGVEKLRQLHQFLTVFLCDFVSPIASRTYDESLISILRLLLQYHDPLLSLHLDQRLVNIGTFLLDWVRRFFVVNGDFSGALAMWDWVLIVGDPTLVVYFAMVYLISHRQRLLTLQTKEELMNELENMRFVIPTRREEAVGHELSDGRPVSFVTLSSGKSLAQNADIAYQNTPRGTQRVVDFLFFPEEGGINKTPEALARYYAAQTALPVERSDLADSFSVHLASHPPHGSPRSESAPLDFIIVDCRAGESFRFARLPTAIHVGDTIGFDDEKLDHMVEMLRAVRGTHLCVFGTGRDLPDEVNLLQMVLLRLLQKGFPYISLAPGGFRTIVPLIKSGRIVIVRDGDGGLSGSGETLKQSITELLPRFDKEEAWRKAEELRSIAKDQVTAAKSWGRSMMQRFSDKLQRTAPANTNTNATTGATRKDTQPASHAPKVNPAAVAGENKTTPFPSSEQQQQQRHVRGGGAKVFSLGVDEDDDADEDFNLITTVPVHTGSVSQRGDGELLATGKVIPNLAEPSTSDTNASNPTGANAESNISSPTAKTSPETAAVVESHDGVTPHIAETSEASTTARETNKDIASEIDEEFDKLFGGPASPPQSLATAREASQPTAERSSADDLFADS